MRQRWVYRPDRNGHYRAIPCEGPLPSRLEGTIPSMEERVVKDLYHMEQVQGSKFSGVGEFSKSQLKAIWVDNVGRDNAIERKREQALSRAQGE